MPPKEGKVITTIERQIAAIREMLRYASGDEYDYAMRLLGEMEYTLSGLEMYLNDATFEARWEDEESDLWV